MEIRKGHKQTDVGLIPEEWLVLPINKVAQVIGGGTPSTFNTAYWNGNINWYTPAEIGNSKYSYESLRKITENGLRNSSAKLLPVDSILLTSRATIGEMSILKNEAATNQGFQSLIPRQGVNVEFIYYAVGFQKKQLFENASGSTFLEISPNKVKGVLLLFPPTKAEQTAIATALSDMDALIAGLEKLIEKKRAIKLGVMQKLLRPKEGWETIKLKELIFGFQNGYAFSANGYVTSGVPIVTMAHIGLDGTFNYDETKVNHWEESEYDALKNFHLSDGDLIIAMTDVTPDKNLIGRMAIVHSNHPLLLNQRVGLIRIDSKKVNGYVLKTLSNMGKWRMYCIGSASLGVQANLGTKDILSGEFELPEISEQNRIASILLDIDWEIESLEQQLQKSKNLKVGMMQELLTGKIRLI